MADEVAIWNKVMASALSMPSVKVNRKKFLLENFVSICNTEDLQKMLVTCPQMVLDKVTIEKVSKKIINNHLLKVTSLSALAGLPGGWAMAATIPVDLAQYFWHVFVLAQKLAYLHGLPSILDENGNLTEDGEGMLTLFTGIMLGAGIANKLLKEISKRFAEQVAYRLPQKALTKIAAYNVIKQIAKWLGVKLTKDTFAKGVAKCIPIISSGINGTITYVAFNKQSKRLLDELQEDMDIYCNAFNSSKGNSNDKNKGEYTDYEEV